MAHEQAIGDEHDIPVVDPSVLPEMVVEGTYDWRAALDEVREQHEFFRFGDDPMICFSRYEAVRELFLDWELFSSVKPNSPFYAVPVDEDPPKALALRRAMMPMYSASTVDRWKPRMRERVRELVGSFADAGQVEFVSQFAALYFPHVAAEWMGAPPEECAQMAEWDHKVFRLQSDPESLNKPMSGDHKALMAKDTIAHIVEYCEELVERKRAEPDDSLASFATTITIDGEPLPKREQVALVVMAAFGSGHTVAAHLTYFFYHLARHPADRQALLDDPGLIDSANEEILRYYEPGGLLRIATRDAEFHGCPIKKGDPVFAMFSQPNRDSRAGFESRVRLDRKPNPHLAFQVGVHRCAGIEWARVASRIAIEEWHAVIPEYRIQDGEPFVEQLYAGHGFHTLPLVWET